MGSGRRAGALITYPYPTPTLTPNPTPNPNQVRADVAQNLMRLIAEGSGEDEDEDEALRKFAAQTYFEVLNKPNLPDVLMQVVCSV